MRMEGTEAQTSRLRSLGLLGNPFDVDMSSSADPRGTEVASRAAAFRLLGAIGATKSDPSHTPIILEKSPDVHSYYSVTSMVFVMKALVDGEIIPGSIPAYIPLDMMRLGRVRALLAEMAERIAGHTPDLVIGTWSRRTLIEPDASLPEWDALLATGFDRDEALADIQADPRAFCARVFGELAETREGADDFEALMRVSTSRKETLEVDPEMDSADLAPEAEDNPEDRLAEVFTVPLGEIDEGALPDAVDERLPELLLGDYIVAYTKAHLSPVVARGIRAYRAQGYASMAEELKISKAPTKSLLAIFEFSKGVYDLGVALYDRIEMWETVPAELRSAIVQTLTELRRNLKDHAVMVFMLEPETAPELEAGFPDATRVEWSFKELSTIEHETLADTELLTYWIGSAGIDGVMPSWADAAVEAIPEGTTLDLACRALSRAIGDAVAEGETQVGPALVSSALVAEKEAAPA